MKLICNVEVYNRLSTLAINASRRKPQRSCLAIGRQSIKSDEIHLMLQTQSNKVGTKYKINDNIEKVFTKFINEGKATIRFMEPTHDINIQCDVIQLKSFLHVLKLVILKKLDPAIMTLSNLKPKVLRDAPRTKVVIKQASDYPIFQGFPRITEELHLHGLQRKSFDRQILKLQSLRILNLSENQLSNLPQELGMLPNLQELNLADNQLGKCPMSKWSWMNGSNISKTLRLLNLNSNKLTKLPDQISKLHGLLTLYVNNNLISNLPQGIGSLNKLKFLVLSKNNLTHLPGSMKNLQLSELDISENPLQINDNSMKNVANINAPSLIDIAAQIVLRSRIYYNASIIPLTLVEYLDKAYYCICGMPCFNSCFMRTLIPINLSTIADSIKFSGASGNNILSDCYFCSMRCFQKCVRF